MALTKAESTALAEFIVGNQELFTVSREDKMNQAIDMRIESIESRRKAMKEKRESMARRKAAMSETFDKAAAMGYGNNRTRTGD